MGFIAARRDAMYSHDSRYVARCPSVRLSVCHVCCLEMAEHILKLFSPSGSSTAPLPQFLKTKYYDYTVRRDRHNVGVECMWSMKNRDFQQIPRFISEKTKDRAILCETAISNDAIFNDLE